MKIHAWLAMAALFCGGCELLSLDYLQDRTDAGDASLDAGADAKAAPGDAGASAADAADAATLPYLVYYHFDHDTLDSSGNGADGTLVGQASVDAPGVKGSALACGHPGDALTFPATKFLPGTTGFTVAFFFRLTVVDGGLASTENTFFWKGSAWENSQDTTPGTAIGYWDFLPTYLNGVVNDGATTRDGFVTAGYLPESPPDPPLVDGRFHHAALVLDRARAELLLYVDGVLRAQPFVPDSSDGGPFGSIDAPFPGQLCAETSDYLWPLYGAIDEFMLIGRALTAAEVAALAAQATAGDD